MCIKLQQVHVYWSYETYRYSSSLMWQYFHFQAWLLNVRNKILSRKKLTKNIYLLYKRFYGFLIRKIPNNTIKINLCGIARLNAKSC